MEESRDPDKETKANKNQIISSNLQGHWLLSIVRLSFSRDKQVRIKDNVSGRQKGGVGMCSGLLLEAELHENRQKLSRLNNVTFTAVMFDHLLCWTSLLPIKS